jgi:electron transport complex protein RnfG
MIHIKSSKYKITKLVNKYVSKEKQTEIKYYLRIGVTLLIIASVTATLLAFVNALTKERIAENELAVMQEAIGRLFDGSDGIKSVEGDYEAPVVAVYNVYKGDELLGRGIQVSPTGFKEAIGMIVGVDGEGKCIGVEIISISDTPGVGTKVKEQSFLDGFAGLDENDIDNAKLISGATVSSTAVRNGVKAALELKLEEKPQSSEVSDTEAENTDNTPDTSNGGAE